MYYLPGKLVDAINGKEDEILKAAVSKLRRT